MLSIKEYLVRLMNLYQQCQMLIKWEKKHLQIFSEVLGTFMDLLEFKILLIIPGTMMNQRDYSQQLRQELTFQEGFCGMRVSIHN
jgi:hypothetical protein